MSAHNMDEWVSCADGMRGCADTESDAFSDAFAHGCANTVADGSADGESNAEPNAGTDAAVLAWRASRCWWRVCFVRAWSLQRHCECGAVQVVLYWSIHEHEGLGALLAVSCQCIWQECSLEVIV